MTACNASDDFLHQICRCIRTGGRITKGLSNVCTPHTVDTVMMEGGHGDSPLGFAIQNKHWDLAQFLVRRGANVNFRPAIGLSPMCILIRTRTSHNQEWERNVLLNVILEEISREDLRFFLHQDCVGFIPPLIAVCNDSILCWLLCHEEVSEHALSHENLATGNNVLMDHICFKNKHPELRSSVSSDHEDVFHVIAENLHEFDSTFAWRLIFTHRNENRQNLLRVAMQEQDLSIVRCLSCR